MEIILKNMPAIMPAVLILMVVTNIITQVLKKVTWDKIPTNVVAVVVAMVLTLAAFFAGCEIMKIDITWYMIAGAVVLGFFVAFAAMFGFDKLRQTLSQIIAMRKEK